MIGRPGIDQIAAPSLRAGAASRDRGALAATEGAALAATDIRLYDATDLAWIALIVDHVMSCLGQPWRVLREQLEHAPIRAARVTAILAAMRRVMGGRDDRAKIARAVRARVLGHPALDAEARTARLAAAEDELGIAAGDVESLLWIDLAEERPVRLPDGRPDETRLAAFANVDRIARALRRARHVRIRAWGDAHALIRMAARCGLLATVSAPEASSPDLLAPPRPRELDEMVIDIVGPLSLFHQTTIYGRALGAIVPMLASLDRFVVEIDADFGDGPAALRVASPALLPPAPAERGTPSIAFRIASALERRRVCVERDPLPIAHGRARLFPDLAIDAPEDDRAQRDDHAPLRATRWYIEVIGFATAEYLAARLARYAAAGIERVVLVADATRAPGLAGSGRVVPFRSRSIATDLLAIIEEHR